MAALDFSFILGWTCPIHWVICQVTFGEAFSLLETLKSGLRWRIGDGQKARIWQDSLLLADISNLIPHSDQLLPYNSYVGALIDRKRCC